MRVWEQAGPRFVLTHEHTNIKRIKSQEITLENIEITDCLSKFDLSKAQPLSFLEFKSYIHTIKHGNINDKKALQKIVLIGKLNCNLAKDLDISNANVYITKNVIRSLNIFQNDNINRLRYEELENLIKIINKIDKAYIDIKYKSIALCIKDTKYPDKFNMIYIKRDINGNYIHLIRKQNENTDFTKRYKEIN